MRAAVSEDLRGKRVRREHDVCGVSRIFKRSTGEGADLQSRICIEKLGALKGKVLRALARDEK